MLKLFNELYDLISFNSNPSKYMVQQDARWTGLFPKNPILTC